MLIESFKPFLQKQAAQLRGWLTLRPSRFGCCSFPPWEQGKRHATQSLKDPLQGRLSFLSLSRLLTHTREGRILALLLLPQQQKQQLTCSKRPPKGTHTHNKALRRSFHLSSSSLRTLLESWLPLLLHCLVAAVFPLGSNLFPGIPFFNEQQ